MTNSISLHAFCKENGNLPKTSVRRWLNDNGYSTSEGLSPLAVKAALEQFCPDAAPAAAEAAAAGGMTIAVGNHRGDLALPQPPAGIDLGTYRGENAALTNFEPEDIERFLAACDGFVEAVDADYQYQQSVTQRKEAAAAQVKAKVEQVKQAQMLYQLRSETLALHNRGLDAELATGMATLGKPAEADTAG